MLDLFWVLEIGWRNRAGEAGGGGTYDSVTQYAPNALHASTRSGMSSAVLLAPPYLIVPTEEKVSENVLDKVMCAGLSFESSGPEKI